MGSVLEYSAFMELRRQTVKEPSEQFERDKAKAIAAIETTREKLAAARQRPGGDFVDDLIDGLDRALILLDGFDPALEQDVAQLTRTRNLLHALFANLAQRLAVDALEATLSRYQNHTAFQQFKLRSPPFSGHGMNNWV